MQARGLSSIWKAAAMAAGLAWLPNLGQAAIIADLNGDFSAVTFPAGWEYLRTTAAIGNDANYTALVWDAGNGFYDLDGTLFPAAGPDYSLFAAGGVLHPGRGTAQGQAFDGFVILAYTIQAGEAGYVSVVNGTIEGNDGNGAGGASNGWEIQIYVGNVQAGATAVVPWSLASTGFSQGLGTLNVGDTVYVAVGPRGSHLYDSATVGFQLERVPEPGALGLVGLGLAAMMLRRRR